MSHSVAHLGGCSDGSIGSQVETPLSKLHHGLIAPVFGLSNVLIDLLQQSKGNGQTMANRAFSRDDGTQIVFNGALTLSLLDRVGWTNLR